MVLPNGYLEDTHLFQTITNHNTSSNNNVEGNGHHDLLKQNNEEIESTYLTSVSKKPITLRKTESLKLDSVQSIRNRFNRVNSNNIGSLTR